MNTANFINPESIKSFSTAAVAVITGFFAPLLPYVFLCTVFVLVDMFTAWRLGQRLSRSRGEGFRNAGKLSSRRFRRVVTTLSTIYLSLTLAALVQRILVDGSGFSFDCVRFVAGAVCFWQLLSVLENVSTCSDASWARSARKFLIDKTSRHIDL